MADDNPERDADLLATLMRRRRFLAGSAGAGTLALAGCTGGDGGDGGDGSDGGDGGDGTDGGDGGDGSDGGDGGDGGDGDDGGPSGRVNMLTTPEGSAGHVMGNGMMSLLSQESNLTGSAQAGTGSQANIASIMRGEADLTMGVTQILVDAYNRDAPFDQDDFEYDPLQLHTFYNVLVGIGAKVGSDYQYISDLEGEPIAVGPRETSFYPNLRTFLEMILDDYNPVYQAPPDIGSQLAAGNVEAAIVLALGTGQLPSWVQETVTSSDVRLLGVEEADASAIEENPAATTVNQPNDFWGDDIQEFVTEPETMITSTNYSAVSSMATDADVVYTIMETAWDNREQLTDVHPAFEYWLEDESWVELVDPRLPFHPGAAEFLREQDLWSDEFQEAEA